MREASLELASFANKVAGARGGEVKSLVIGSGIGDLASELAGKGGGEVFVADDAALANYNVDAWHPGHPRGRGGIGRQTWS